MNLKPFFKPKTIAIIGATKNPQKVGYALIENLSNFKGKVIPINPKYEYKSVLAYKGKIDLAVIAIPAKFINNALKECGKKKIKNIIVISAGFSEIGNKKAEQELQVIIKKYKLNLLGPNCFGVLNTENNLNTTFAKTLPQKGDIALISQSGALWSYISDLDLKGAGFSKFISLGNMAGTSFSDFIKYLSKDKKTKSIILYIEKIKQGKKFIKIAKKCKKPIYVIKAGSSKQGEKAAISHTGSLATDYEIYKGAFKQAGVILCPTLVEALEKASKKKLIKTKKQKLGLNKEIIIITNAGGAGALAADYCSAAGLNPKVKDILGTALAKDYQLTLKRNKKAQSIIILLTPQLMSEIPETTKAILEFKKTFKTPIVVGLLGEKSVKQSCTLLNKKKIPCFTTLKELKVNLS